MRRLKRDPKKVRSSIEIKPDGKYYCNEKLTIEVPSWYIDKGMLVFGQDTFFYGVAAIIIGDYYSVMNVPTLIRTRPVNIKSVKHEDGMEYTQLEYMPGDMFITDKKVVQETLLSYAYFSDYIIRSKVPWFISYEDMIRVLNNFKKYANSNIGVNPIANESVVSYVTRTEDDPDMYFRHAPKGVKPRFIDLMNMFHAIKPTVNKISGGYLETGITAAYVKEPSPPTKLEIHLKDRG